jgi:hypothetical protein
MTIPREFYAPELWQELHEKYPEVYPALTIEEHREDESRKIREKYANMMADIVKPYRQTERETWPTQVAEANLFLADPAADVPLITALATSRGVGIADLVSRIKGNEALYREAVGTLLGQQQAELDALG